VFSLSPWSATSFSIDDATARLMRPLRAQLAATMIYLKGKKENKKGIKTP
jgi:hypothetical protein